MDDLLRPQVVDDRFSKRVEQRRDPVSDGDSGGQQTAPGGRWRGRAARNCRGHDGLQSWTLASNLDF
jgi:hypothetical protein